MNKVTLFYRCGLCQEVIKFTRTVNSEIESFEIKGEDVIFYLKDGDIFTDQYWRLHDQCKDYCDRRGLSTFCGIEQEIGN